MTTEPDQADARGPRRGAVAEPAEDFGPDWSRSPARWPIIVVLATASVVGLVWSARTRTPPAPMITPVLPMTTPTPVATAESAPPPSTTTQAPPSIAPPPALSPMPSTTSPSPSPIARRVHLNTATQAELELLPGIGPTLAVRILEDRQTHGPFRSVDDLQRVRGIGARTVDRLREYATTGP